MKKNHKSFEKKNTTKVVKRILATFDDLNRNHCRRLVLGSERSNGQRIVHFRMFYCKSENDKSPHTKSDYERNWINYFYKKFSHTQESFGAHRLLAGQIKTPTYYPKRLIQTIIELMKIEFFKTVFHMHVSRSYKFREQF